MQDTYIIPVNFTDAGRLFGMFEIRNTVEAALLGIPLVYLCAHFLPLAFTAKVIVTLIIFVPAAGFALIGISDDSLSEHLLCRLRFLNRRAVLTFRGEVNYREFEKSYFRDRR